MKRIILTVAAIVFFLQSEAQVFQVQNGTGATSANMVFTPRDNKDNTEEFKKIAHKMYLTTAYLPAKVDNIDQTFYLRYNIFEDEMEFVKGEDILYLKKQAGRNVNFTGLDTKYKILNHNGDLQYFVVNSEGKASLLTKLVVKYYEAAPAKSSYQKAVPADFKRRKDELYLMMGDDMMRIPSKKNSFLELFGDKSSDIKNFMKKNKLGTKKLEDVKKAVDYYNTL